ncbi:magnesium transporter CorA family protein [Chitinophagales bacterium]|jgi:magnesium transporter|nr:magnesium transporter CorA family protein [Chitinophagales bacterium]
MIKVLKKSGGRLVEIQEIEPGCWVNIYPPFSKENLEEIAEMHDLPLDFLTDSLDRDEQSRFESEEEADLVVLNTPILNNDLIDNEALYLTIPIGIVSKPDYIITICSYENRVIDDFLFNRIKGFDPADQSLFTLQLFNRNVYYFQYYLREINNKRYSFENEIYRSSRSKDLKRLLDLQKSLIYFVTNLRSNDLMMNKLRRTNFLKIREDEFKEDFLEDIVVDSGQAIEMADIYTNILNGTMDSFASIISNNLGIVVQRLTAVTIVLMVPTLLASFYGMNVRLPLQEGNEHNFLPFTVIIALSLAFSGVLGWFFMKKRWF